ncbi:MAG: hypothetical protein E5Y10_22245 [Mesorhizobium sp.]|uniref:DUF6441 family protein n=1 Tax=Mesorhizobium sp. TaxID=1871066 RepID=UPI00121FC1AE|nr:DUF6441 family protein [Mesorhizobium sp.]TIN36851.1 MAG: hypothetical protein E5Y13_22855 [Mesorhizobium sp.]TJU81357.1 MAG: hypothetical protein E5Y15_21225 [Mesorhizobium sp.]TJU86696.1 MAG: hypothetical protein E5Y10_22245 [Mesorhizobium sp.]
MAGKLRITVSDPSDAWVKAMRDRYKPIAKAATRAVIQVADGIKAEGRADIISAGFSRRWANAFRVNVYPKGGVVSVDAAALVYHKVPYADVFETGARIAGSPYLWLPLPDAPRGRGGARIPASQYRLRVGHPLYAIKRPGKAPLLGANIKSTAARSQKGVSLSQLKRGRNPGGRGTVRMVPLYVGVRQVDIKQKFHLRAITAANASKLAAFYYRSFLDE